MSAHEANNADLWEGIAISLRNTLILARKIGSKQFPATRTETVVANEVINRTCDLRDDLIDWQYITKEQAE